MPPRQPWESYSGYECWKITTGPSQIKFSGDSQRLLDEKLSALFANLPLEIRLIKWDANSPYDLHFRAVSPEQAEYFSFETMTRPVQVAIDASGMIQVPSFSGAQSEVMIRRFKTPFAMTDAALASLGAVNSLSFQASEPLAIAPASSSCDRPHWHFDFRLVPTDLPESYMIEITPRSIEHPGDLVIVAIANQNFAFRTLNAIRLEPMKPILTGPVSRNELAQLPNLYVGYWNGGFLPSFDLTRDALCPLPQQPLTSQQQLQTQ